MRVLFATGNSASYLLPPQLGDKQVNCGPDWTDDVAPDGLMRSMATPAGEYDLAKVATRLPSEQQPDVVVCLVDASWRNLPRNLTAFKCPRVLLVADTHHLKSPLIGMLRYVASEPFDRIVLLSDRHHASFFHAAGLRNLYWFPGLTFPHRDAAVCAARRAKREPNIAVVGKPGNPHPLMARLLVALAARKVPFAQQQASQAENLEFYGRSLLGLNASVNGDLNLRIFELLATGAAVLTDRLASDAGLDELWADEREILTYRTAAELADLAAALIARPSEAQAIGAAGTEWFDTHFNEVRRWDSFRRLVFDGTAAFPLPCIAKPTMSFGGNVDQLLQALLVYEDVQELHRLQESVCVELDPSAPADFAKMFATLPRVKTVHLGSSTKADLAVFSRESISPSAVGTATSIWCWNVAKEDVPPLAKQMAESGLTLTRNDVAVFCQKEVSASGTAAMLLEARELLRRKEVNEALALTQKVLWQNPNDPRALCLAGDIAWANHKPETAELLFRGSLRFDPANVEIKISLAAVLQEQNRYPEAGRLIALVLNKCPSHQRALIALARSHLAEQRFEEAETVIQRVIASHPIHPSLELGNVLKRCGALAQGLQWHRRAVGCCAPIPSIDFSTRRVRVTFLLQNPQGCIGLKSVWEAFSADRNYVPDILAAPYYHPCRPVWEPEAIYAFLEQQGMPYRRWDTVRLEPNFTDVLFLQLPYDKTRPDELSVPALLRLVPRLVYAPYGFNMSGSSQYRRVQFDLPLHQAAWMIFSLSRREKALYAQYCASGDAHVVVTGSPKLDPLRKLPTIRDQALEQFAAGRRLVFWNPHFDIRLNGTAFGAGFSTFLRWRDFMPEEFRRRQNLAFVIRPHPLFFGTLEARGIMTKTQIDEFVGRCAAAGNIEIDRRPSHVPVFAASSAMISDASSFLLEYASTGKPLLYLHNPHGPGLDSFGDFIRTHCYTAETEPEISRFLDLIETGADPRGVARRAALPEIIYAPKDGAGEAIKQAVTQRLLAENAAGRHSLARRELHLDTA